MSKVYRCGKRLGMHPLKKYLADSGIPLKDFAARVGTKSAYLCHVMAGRKKSIGVDLIEAIIRETGGQLTYKDFKPEKAEQLDRIKELESQAQKQI